MRGLLCNPNYIEAALGTVGAIIAGIWFWDALLFQKAPYYKIPILLGGMVGGTIGFAIQFIVIRVFGPLC
jgi:hypothetical protein